DPDHAGRRARIETSAPEQLLKVKLLDVIALQAGDLIEQAAGAALLQNLLRSRAGVKPALGHRFIQDPGEPRFGLGVILPALTIKEVGDAQAAARPCFNPESAAHASACFSDL